MAIKSSTAVYLKIATNVLYVEIFTTNVSYLPIWTCKSHQNVKVLVLDSKRNIFEASYTNIDL